MGAKRSFASLMVVIGGLAPSCGQVPDHTTDAVLAQNSCWSCHGDLYAATADPDHAGGEFSHACERCHGTDQWQPAQFDDHERFWPLTGAHTTVDCAACHADRHYTGTPRDCEGCHLPDFDATTHPPHRTGGYPTTCATCHTDAAWRPADFDHGQFWALEGQHATTDCAACHEGGVFANTPSTCVACHQPDYDATTDPDHRAAGYPSSCAVCHDAAAWRLASYTGHDALWPLEGRHAQTACSACHVGDVFVGTARACEGCHQPAFDATTRPNHRAESIPNTCGACHTPNGWSPADYEAHDTFWVLEDKHLEVSCADCHEDGLYAGTPRDCDGCHHDDFVATTEPDHVAATYPTDCTVCHTAAGWTPSPFDHEAQWPLQGTHLLCACSECHAEGHYAGTARTCEGCHQADYAATAAPPHASANITKDCASCHTAAGWAPAELDHALYWPLTDKHVGPTCLDCHANGVYAAVPRACEACHQPDYDATTEPPHAAAEIVQDCASCHTAVGWAPADFDHTRYWPLTGKHTEPTCADCHAGSVYVGTARTCEGCHRPDYDASLEPPHAALGYPTDCAPCHTDAAWRPASFDHALTWPLRGQHATTACADCHLAGVFAGTAKSCADCHKADFDATADPRHLNAGFLSDCATCHTEEAWTPSSFIHTPLWPLTGRHRGVACITCHVNEVYDGTSRACASCHWPAYTASVTPPHAADGYPTDCAPCHTVSAWRPADFDHAASWALNGQHAVTPCAACHAGGVFATTPIACATCHQGDFDATAAPSHAQAGFSQDCASCHDETRWQPSRFVHTATWPITGQHTQTSCNACHQGGVFAGTLTACEDCHLTDYAATTDPPHAADGYPTDCARCHAPAGWTPNTFDHESVWPLRGGHTVAHCYDCHSAGPFAGTPSDCAACHQAEFTAASDPDHVQAGFGQDCVSCHTESAWQPSSFAHTPSWPLTAKHTLVGCNACHQGGVFVGTPTACDACHHDRYLTTTAPPHVAAGFGTDCATCHTAATWGDGVFDHASWPLTGAHASATCSGCHSGGVFAGTATQCNNCHHPEYVEATNPSHTALALSTTCQTCHTTSNWATNTFPVHEPLFPIATGDHRSFTCAQCHKTASVAWSNFTCVGCHTGEHLLTKMNSEHDEVLDYASTLAAASNVDHGCYQCHPTGKD